MSAVQIEATSTQKSLNVTRKPSVTAADGNVTSTTASKPAAADRKLRNGGRPLVLDTSKPPGSSVLVKTAAASKQQVCFY